MKINTPFTFATLITLVNALPNAVHAEKRQVFTNSTTSAIPTGGDALGAGGRSTSGLFSNATGGAGVAPVNTGVVTTTVVQTVTSIVSQPYTTYPVTQLFTETIVIPNGGAGVAPVATNAPGSSPNNPTVVVVAGTTSNTGSGTSGSGSGTGSGSGSSGSGSSGSGSSGSGSSGSGSSGSGSSGSGSGSGSGTGSGSACVCSVPVVVATGIYTVTVQNIVNLGTTTLTTAYPTTTLGVFTVSAGTVVPAVATVTRSAVIATNTNAALAPGQSYQTITIPGTSTTIVVVVSVISDVVSPIANPNGGNGVGALPNTASATPSTAPFTNSSMSSTALNGGAGLGAQGLSTLSGATLTSSLSADAAIGTAVSGTGNPNTVVASTTAAVPAATATAAAPGSPVAGTNAVAVGSLGTTPLYNQDAFINDMLSYHNTLRARNSAPAMTWNPALAQVALNNVNANAAGRTFLHTKEMGIDDPYGENIAEQYGYNNPQYLVWLWYEENKSYSYDNPVFAENTGHFTQVVWVDSTELGCAYTQANDSEGTYYLACEYSPPGNYAGEFSANVLPMTGSGQPDQPSMYI